MDWGVKEQDKLDNDLKKKISRKGLLRTHFELDLKSENKSTSNETECGRNVPNRGTSQERAQKLVKVAYD